LPSPIQKHTFSTILVDNCVKMSKQIEIIQAAKLFNLLLFYCHFLFLAILLNVHNVKNISNGKFMKAESTALAVIFDT